MGQTGSKTDWGTGVRLRQPPRRRGGEREGSLHLTSPFFQIKKERNEELIPSMTPLFLWGACLRVTLVLPVRLKNIRRFLANVVWLRNLSIQN